MYKHKLVKLQFSNRSNTHQKMQNLLGTPVLSEHLDPSVFHQQRAPLCWEDALWLLCFAKWLADTKTNRRAGGTFPLTDLTISCVLHIKHSIDPQDQFVNHLVFCMLPQSIFPLQSRQLDEVDIIVPCLCASVVCEAVGQIRPLYVTGEAANKKQCKQM